MAERTFVCPECDEVVAAAELNEGLEDDFVNVFDIGDEDVVVFCPKCDEGSYVQDWEEVQEQDQETE